MSAAPHGTSFIPAQDLIPQPTSGSMESIPPLSAARSTVIPVPVKEALEPAGVHGTVLSASAYAPILAPSVPQASLSKDLDMEAQLPISYVDLVQNEGLSVLSESVPELKAQKEERSEAADGRGAEASPYVDGLGTTQSVAEIDEPQLLLAVHDMTITAAPLSSISSSSSIMSTVPILEEAVDGTCASSANVSSASINADNPIPSTVVSGCSATLSNISSSSSSSSPISTASYRRQTQAGQGEGPPVPRARRSTVGSSSSIIRPGNSLQGPSALPRTAETSTASSTVLSAMPAHPQVQSSSPRPTFRVAPPVPTRITMRIPPPIRPKSSAIAPPHATAATSSHPITPSPLSISANAGSHPHHPIDPPPSPPYRREHQGNGSAPSSGRLLPDSTEVGYMA